MRFGASKGAIPQTWCGQLAEDALWAGWARFGWGDGPNLGPKAQERRTLILSRPETQDRGHGDGGEMPQRRWKRAATEPAWRPESSARPPHWRSIGLEGWGYKAQEWCKVCGGLWEGWKTGTGWGCRMLALERPVALTTLQGGRSLTGDGQLHDALTEGGGIECAIDPLEAGKGQRNGIPLGADPVRAVVAGEIGSISVSRLQPI